MSENSTSNIGFANLNNDELRQLIEQAQAVLAEREAEAAGRRMVKFENIRVAHGTSGQTVLVFSPYHPDLVRDSRSLNGKWQSGNSSWKFDIRDEERVRGIVREVYGTDGSTEVEVVDVQMVIDDNNGGGKQLFALGREIASRPGRDARVRLGDRVTIVSGEFPPSAGSSKYPSLIRNEPVTVLVRDVPAVLADVAAATDPDVYQIV